MRKETAIKIFTGIMFSALMSLSVINCAYADNTVSKEFADNQKTADKNIEQPLVSNGLFSFTLPAGAKGLYSANKRGKGIYIYDKASKKAGFGGFAFGIAAFKNPEDYASAPGSRKIGELTDKKNVLYDMVLVQPTDVQFDYTKAEPESYKLLYGLADTTGGKITGVKGSKYFDKQGTKGEFLYQDILKKHVRAIKEKWNSQKLENENMSYMYYTMSVAGKNVLKNAGYAYYDVNGDGIDELLIGEILKGNSKGIIYDIYTMVNRKPAHVACGGSRNRYFVTNNSFIVNEYSGGANESVSIVYFLTENSIELFPQVGFKYDGYSNKKNPWFISYDFVHDNWENVSYKTYKERKATFERYKRFDFIPFSQLKY